MNTATHTGAEGSLTKVSPLAPALRTFTSPHPQSTALVAPDVTGALDRLSRTVARLVARCDDHEAQAQTQVRDGDAS